MTEFTTEEAKSVADKLGITFDKFDLEQFTRGLNVEFEHGLRDPQTNITSNDPEATGKIAWAHLKEIPNYYDLLDEMEKSAKS
jgi:hypothetical protein